MLTKLTRCRGCQGEFLRATAMFGVKHMNPSGSINTPKARNIA